MVKLKNCWIGEKIGGKKKQPPDSRTRGPAAPTVLVLKYFTKMSFPALLISHNNHFAKPKTATCGV